VYILVSSDKMSGATISQESKDKSTEFITLLSSVMEIVFTLADKIDDGNYVNLCNKLRDLYNLDRDENVARVIISYLEETDVVQEHRRRSEMRVRTKKTELLDDYAKLKTKQYVRCENCSRVVLKSYFNCHKKTSVCIRTNSTKNLSANIGERDTARYEDLICKITALKKFKRREEELEESE